MKTSSHRILTTETVNSNSARMVARITTAGFDEEIKALDKKLNARRLGIVRGSMKVCASGPLYRTAAFHVCPLGGEQPDSVTNRARMVALASSEIDSNMFMDHNDNVWEAVNGKLLRRNHFDTQAHMDNAMKGLATASVMERQAAVAAVAVATGEIESGNFCVFVDGAVIGDGYIVACDMDAGCAYVLPRPDDAANPYPARTVAFGDIVEAFDWADRVKEVPANPEFQMTAEAGALNLNQATEYYKGIYGYNPRFWGEWNKLMKERGTY